MKKLFTLIVIIALTISVFAQSPQKMSYQAVIRNASGVLMANQAVGVRIQILQTSEFGAAVYVETHTATTNVNGLVTLEIGSGNVILGTFADINWANGPYFIKTETDISGGTNYSITGASQILSVPYALYAKNASSYNETDPVFETTPAKNITSGNITDWNSAYSWGNHTGLYRTASWVPTWSDVTGKPAFASVATSGSFADLSGKPTTLAGYGIADGMSTSHPANAITSTNITNWNTAYGWGNHAGLYRPISYVPAWSEITSKPTTVSGYGITDAVTLTGNQTISGIKTFTSDIAVNGTTVGKGQNSVSSNTAVGYQALNSNFTTGFGNTAFGCRALYYNMTGRVNTAFGDSALYTNSTGYGNTANGYKALYSNLDGPNNTAFGTNSLQKNIGGGDNTAIGNGALFSNTSGALNTACGRASLLNNTSGNNNTATGYGALAMSQLPSFNTAIGAEAAYNCKNGSYNTATGYKALKGDVTTGAGHHNTAMGNEALTNIAGGHNNTSTGSISLQSLTTGSGNTANGFSALNFTTTGAHNTGIGVNAGNNNTTGNDNICIGYFSNVESNNLTNATAIGYNAIVNASNKIVLGNASATTVGGYGIWTNYSDRRLKENISYENKLGLNFITRLKPVIFNYIDDANKHLRQGLIAQDVELILNELGLEFSGLIIDDDQEKTMNLSYPAFVIPLITAVQEQQKQIDELKQLVSSLMQK